MGLREPLLYSQALNYLKKLSSKGVSVYLLSFEKKQFLTKDSLTSLKNELDTAGITWFFLKYHKRFQFISKPYDIIRGMFFVLYVTCRENIDVIHARGTMCAIIGMLGWFFMKKKMIFDMRGLMAEEYLDAGLWRKDGFAYTCVNRFERYFLKHSDEVVVLTHKIKDMQTRKYAIKHATVIPTCVDLERFNVYEDCGDAVKTRYSLGGKFVVIYTGSLGTWYMFSEMLDFYKELIISMPDTTFFILSQTERAWIEQQIPDDVRKNVIIDSTDPWNVASFLNVADAGIFFIKPCLSKIASCPTKFGEYLACGLPVIINKGIGDTEELVRKEKIGVVIEDFNIEEYRKRILEMRELLREGDALRSRCRSVAERHFSLKDGSEKYADIYVRLAQRKN